MSFTSFEVFVQVGFKHLSLEQITNTSNPMIYTIDVITDVALRAHLWNQSLSIIIKCLPRKTLCFSPLTIKRF